MLVHPKHIQRYWIVIMAVASGCLLLAIIASLFVGSIWLPVKIVAQTLLGMGEGQAQLIILELRLPRALLAVCVGGMLAACGTVTQGLFRNPLADPSLIGVTAGASAGASLVIVFFSASGSSLLGLSMVSFGAFFGSVVAVLFVYRLATRQTGTSVSTMLLAGIAMTFLAGGLSSFLAFIADNDMLRRISLWRMGALDTANYVQVGVALATACVLASTLPRYSSALNTFLLGESEARHLGIDITRVKMVLISLVAAGVGVSVALVGTIAFVGLVVPHFVRLFVGANHKWLLPLSAIVGAFLLVLADMLARILFSPQELPVGLVTTLIGAPIFILLLSRRLQYGSAS